MNVPLDEFGARGYPRSETFPDNKTYSAIVYLRKLGKNRIKFKIYRCGSTHKVNGVVMQNARIIALARAHGWGHDEENNCTDG